MPIEVNVNGLGRTATATPETPLLWVLRDEFGLTGTKFGCGMGLCGACTVHIDGEARRACVTPVGEAAGKSVRTIEVLARDSLYPVQRAWIEEDVAQCGYCQAGQIMTVAAYLDRHPRTTEDEVVRALEGNLCRCGTYIRIRAAIRRLIGGGR